MATSETGPHGAVRADDAAAPEPPGRLPRPALLAALVLGIVALVVEHLVRGNSYWDYSEGVYLFTSRQLLHGADLYGTVVVAQPPPLFVLGAGLLSIQDSLDWMRWAIGALQVGTGLLAATVVWRLTASRAAAAIAAPLVLLTPWAVHEHGSLIPEMIVAPLLLGGVLMAPQARRAPWLGLVAALLPAFKLSYALPALVLIALSADWRRTARWALAAAAAEIALTAVFFGAADVWRDTVQAQFESGHISAHALVGVWAQIAWNLSGLLIAAAVAWALRRRTRDRRTLVVAGATAGATLLTLASTWKLGTSLNSLVPSETALVPLAVAGCAWAVEAARGRAAAAAQGPGRERAAPAGSGRLRAAAIVGALGVAFAVAQGLALVAFPHVHGAHPFLRPGSGPGYGITLSADEVDAAVRAARSCPAKIPYSGTPIIAFIADRPLPANQPDQYLAQLVPVLRPVRDEILAVKTRCPREPPATH